MRHFLLSEKAFLFNTCSVSVTLVRLQPLPQTLLMSCPRTPSSADCDAGDCGAQAARLECHERGARHAHHRRHSQEHGYHGRRLTYRATAWCVEAAPRTAVVYFLQFVLGGRQDRNVTFVLCSALQWSHFWRRQCDCPGPAKHVIPSKV